MKHRAIGIGVIAAITLVALLGSAIPDLAGPAKAPDELDGLKLPALTSHTGTLPGEPTLEAGFASIADHLRIVYYYAGAGVWKVYWPEFGIDTIEALKAGEIYQVYANANCTLIYGTFTHALRGPDWNFMLWPAQPEPPEGLGEARVYFFDVGQADATLLMGPDFTVLIDAGDYRRNDVVPHLNSVGVTGIDLLIGTHPHADHIGQFPQVLQSFTVGEVWLSGDTHTTLTFERAIDAILASGAAYHEPRAGEVFQFGALRIEVLNPTHLTGNFHEGSISIRAVFGDVAFVFTGDAETHTEAGMIGRGHELKAQILQLGHHGSRTSSSVGFLNAVQPEVAVYSAGEGNAYGHPHDEVVERVLGMGIELYGTDVHGTVVAETDGRTYSVSTDSAGDIRGPPSVVGPDPAGELAVDASVKFATLGGGTQTLYATVTKDGEPVQGAEVGITVYYRTVTRTFDAPPTGADGKTQISWSVGRPRGGYTVKIDVVARYEGQTATATTGFYAP